jgi:hypothetical protein
MKLRPFLLIAGAAALFPIQAAAQPTPQRERIDAAVLLTLGRIPTEGELAAWQNGGPLPAAEIIGRLRRQLQADPVLARSVATRACEDAFGRDPADAELQSAIGTGRTYTELVRQHLASLAKDPDEYGKVIDRSYQALLRRNRYPGEIDYWRRQPVLSYVLLVGSVEDWARRNAPGLTETAGIPCVSVSSTHLTIVRLSPPVAAEIRLAAGLVADGDSNLALAAGRNLIAPGGATVVSVGAIHCVVAGDPARFVAADPR